MNCPDCGGSGTIVAAHVRYADGTGEFGKELPCLRCGGKGEVPDEMVEWIEAGRRLRDMRVNGGNYRTMREEAKRRGLSLGDISAMENGRIKPVFPENG